MPEQREKIYVSSRKSQLAMAQTNEVIGMLQVKS
jgi:porphobilinogen deaminase